MPSSSDDTPTGPTGGRQSGCTSKQMQDAPQGALFVWPARRSLGYAKALAQHLGRTDLKIVDPSIFDRGGNQLRGRRVVIVMDHATSCHMTLEQMAEHRRFVEYQNLG